MNFKNFSRAQFSKLRNGINGVGDFRYDTICKPKFRINRITGMEIVRRTKTVHRHTHRDRHKHTHTDTPHTHTHRHTTHTHGGPLKLLLRTLN